MRYQSFLSNISFHFIDPMTAPEANGLYALPKGDGTWVQLLPLSEAPFDLINTRLPNREREIKLRLRDICKIPRMSTFAIGAIINSGVAQMPDGQIFVNVGVWNGFTFFAGMMGNSGKRCIGIDNFSKFDGPRAAFNSRLERFKSQNHRFHEMDYADYFAGVHREPIGFYVYDGEHSYEDQLRGLKLAEPFFADGCIILVDDTNWSEPRKATLDFINESTYGYEILLDAATSQNWHPTFWNGVMVLRKSARAGKRAPSRSKRDRFGPTPPVNKKPNQTSPHLALPIELGPDSRLPTALVSIIINGCDQGRAPTETIESALEQTYLNTEVIVIHSGSNWAKRSIAGFEKQVVAVQSDDAGQASAFKLGFKASRGQLVCMLGPEDVLASDAVEAAIRLREKEHEQDAFFARIDESVREIETLVPAGKPFILVDEDKWGVEEIVTSRRCIPFLEQDGKYWGHPPDDETAIRELERLRQAGARFMVFGWPAFWWFDYYSGLRRHLRSHFRCALENERLVVFDLQG